MYLNLWVGWSLFQSRPEACCEAPTGQAMKSSFLFACVYIVSVCSACCKEAPTGQAHLDVAKLLVSFGLLLQELTRLANNFLSTYAFMELRLLYCLVEPSRHVTSVADAHTLQ